MAKGRDVQMAQGVPETSSAFHRAVDPIAVDAWTLALDVAKKLGHGPIAEDVRGEVANRLMQRLATERKKGETAERERLSNPKALSGWVHLKTAIVARSMRRTGNREDARALKSLNMCDDRNAVFVQPDVPAMQADIDRIVEGALAELSFYHRFVLKAVLGEERKYADVAAQMDKSVDQVRRFLGQAIEAMPPELGDYRGWDAEEERLLPPTQGTRANASFIRPPQVRVQKPGQQEVM